MKIYASPPNRPATQSLLSAITLHGSPALILDCIKRGEDDDDVSTGDFQKSTGRSVILRVYESLGGKARGEIRTELKVRKVMKCNLLEDDEEELKMAHGKVGVELRAFEVATFRLQL